MCKETVKIETDEELYSYINSQISALIKEGEEITEALEIKAEKTGTHYDVTVIKTSIKK
ncbi:hypothetical protein [Clostridium culturomicium]|uniref:hypothetical protein n=1 Tax=Clostridium culturomicium TaxID=1499683 RepID=UPI000B243BC7|nr:hypothetical protein [Clostridium culturomicium]